MQEILDLLKEQTSGLDQSAAIEFVEGFGEQELVEAFITENFGEDTLSEYIVKHVNAKGKVTRKKDRKTRERRALQTTGLSKAKRRQIARRAAKTKRADPSIKRKANRKRKRAMAKRKAFGF